MSIHAVVGMHESVEIQEGKFHQCHQIQLLDTDEPGAKMRGYIVIDYKPNAQPLEIGLAIIDAAIAWAKKVHQRELPKQNVMQPNFARMA